VAITVPAGCLSRATDITCHLADAFIQSDMDHCSKAIGLRSPESPSRGTDGIIFWRSEGFDADRNGQQQDFPSPSSLCFALSVAADAEQVHIAGRQM